MPSLSPARDIALAAASLLAPLSAQDPAAAPGVTFTDAMHPGDRGPDAEHWVVVRAVDGRLGAPLPNAELFAIREGDHPMRGEFRFDMHAMADANGFVRMRIDSAAPGFRKWHWLMLRAPGFGQRMQMNAFDEGVVRLAPAVTLPVQVVDWRGAPVVNALVGFCSGCGHTPDLASGRTGPDGVVRLPGVDRHSGIEDLYVEHPGLGLGYDSVRWLPGDPAARFPVGYGHTSIGIVVDAAGAPVADAFVGTKNRHRGPWTRTAADGSFRLYGHESAYDDLWVWVGDREYLFARPTTEQLRLSLPARTEDGVTVVELPEAEREGSQPRRDADEQRPPADGPRVVVRTAWLPEKGAVYLRTERRIEEITDAVATGTPVALPQEEFVYELRDAENRRRLFSPAEAPERDGVVRLPWFRPTRIEGRVVDEDGEPRQVRLALFDPLQVPGKGDAEVTWQQRDGALALETELESRRMLLAVEDRTHHLRTRLVPVLLPPRADDAFVDLGTIRLQRALRLVLLDRDGTAQTDGDVVLLRHGWHDFHEGRRYPIDAAGSATLPDLQDGDALVFGGDGLEPKVSDDGRLVDLPARFVISGPGPWQLQRPRGELFVHVQRADGMDRVGVTIGEHSMRLEGPTLLRGLTPGRHEVYVGATGHRGAVAVVDVPAEGPARLEFMLPTR